MFGGVEVDAAACLANVYSFGFALTVEFIDPLAFAGRGEGLVARTQDTLKGTPTLVKKIAACFGECTLESL